MDFLGKLDSKRGHHLLYILCIVSNVDPFSKSEIAQPGGLRPLIQVIGPLYILLWVYFSIDAQS